MRTVLSFFSAWSLTLLLFLPPASLAAQEKPVPELLRQAREAYEKGEMARALALASDAVRQEPENALAYYTRGRLHEADGAFDPAIADYTRALQFNPENFQVYQLRGSANFKLGRIEASIEDFDQFLKAAPSQEPHHWQRGISYYYAGRFEEGQKQFELHQTVNDNDVENAVWHFLCLARRSGVETARGSLIKIRRDSRVPMMQVYDLFAGQGKAEEVLSAAQAGAPAEPELKHRLFYAHLYLGLYYEALGETKRSAEHIQKAAEDYKVGHYMWDVARVHAHLRSKAGTKTAPEKK